MKRFVRFIIFLGIICTVIYLYSRYIETKTLKVNEYSIIDKNLPISFHGTKIVHFSDLLFDNDTITIKEIKKIVSKINELKPDIVVFTGNLFNNNYKLNESNKKSLISELTNINSSINKYASITKNDIDYLEILTESNFIILNNENISIYNNDSIPIKLIGFTDNLTNSLKNIIDTDYVIMLSNNPDIIDETNNMNIIFAGKSLGGQIRIPYYGGLIKNTKYIDNNKIKEIPLYINNGIGVTNALKIRLFNTPSINLYRLYNN